MTSDETCEKHITQKVLCFPALKPGYSNISSFEDLVMKFGFQETVNLHLHGTVCVIIKFLYPNSLIIAYFFVPL